MFRPIYEPRTRAREYSDKAINVYTGCDHGCWYCYARKIGYGRKVNENFEDAKPREGLVEATKRQLQSGSTREIK